MRTLASPMHGQVLPCGRCMACRIQKTNEWTIRMEHELEYHKDSCFLTLTYDDEHIPINYSLVKKDISGFFKRFRNYVYYPIRYYYVGEYGDKTLRPHYHAIIFGWYPKEIKFATEKSGRKMYYSPLVEKIWKKGQNIVGVVQHESISYVAGYIRKKLYGKKADEVYQGNEPPFAVMSKGIGKKYALEHKEQILKDLGIKRFGKIIGLPRYYARLLKIPNYLLLSKSWNRDADLIQYYGTEGLHERVVKDRKKRASDIKARTQLFNRSEL